MKKINLTLILILGIKFLYAQKQANNWYFGYNAGITFNTNPPTMLSGGQLNSAEGCTNISDSNGNLLFYSDGVTVWNSAHAVMQNGTGLLGNFSSTQSGVILPAPGSTTLYYLITAPVLGSINPLAYSIIDITLNGGLGGVTVKNVALFDTSAEKVTAVYNQNGTDMWIIAHGFPNDNFYAYLLTSAGINPVPVISSAGNSITNAYNEIGYLKASPCGNQLAMANWNSSSALSTLELFDFNDSTGVVSNGLQIGQWAVSSGVYGVEFSPDNSKLYASIITPAFVVQYDLLAGSAAAIIASMDTIGISPNNFNGALQTGPDGRIYLTKETAQYLACIPNPNQTGSLCGYIENFVSLGTVTGGLGLPDFFSSFFCNIPSGISTTAHEQTILIYPDPFSSFLTISIQRQNIKSLSFTIYNVLGQTIFSKQENHLNSSYTKTIDLSFLSKGIYLLDVIIDGERTVKKIMKD